MFINSLNDIHKSIFTLLHVSIKRSVGERMYKRLLEGSVSEMTFPLATCLQLCPKRFDLREAPFTGLRPDVRSGKVP